MAHDITERAMLVRLNIKRWTARTHDKKVNKEVAQTHGSQEHMGTYLKTLIDKSSLSEVNKITTDARDYHWRMTLPWQDEGVRILPADVYLEYTQKVRQMRVDFERAVEKFLVTYPTLIEEARKDLNGLYNEADYPSAKRLRSLFSYQIRVSPLPAAVDFRVGLDAKEVKRIKQGIEEQTREAFKVATQDLWTRIAEVVGHLSERLKAYEIDETTGKLTGSKFRDSTVENVRSLVDLLPKLNVTADPELEQMTQRMRDGLCSATAADLRTDTAVREAVTQTADEILASMASYLGEAGMRS
jgi:hypothetical protein